MFGFLPMPLAFLFTLTTWATIATVSVAAVTIYSAIEQRKLAKKSLSAQKKLASRQLEQKGQYAGEYLQLTKRQMEMQSEQRQIDTLADLIAAKSDKPRQVFTLPPAKEHSAIDKINMAIGQMLKG